MNTIFIRLLKIFLKVPSSNLPKLNSIKNVIIIRQHNQLGDMLASVPLFRAIKENIPDCSITLVASPDNINAVKQNEFISEIVLFDKKKLHSLKYLISLINSLRSKTYEIGLVPTTVSISFTSGLLLRLVKCKYRIGPKSLDGKIFSGNYMFNESIDFDWREKEDVHITQRILRIIEPLKITTKNFQSHISFTDKDKLLAQEVFRGINSLKIGLHIGAGKIQNRWSASNFAELINKLNFRYKPFFYLTIWQWDEEILSELQNKINFNPMILRDKTIPEIAAVIDRSNLFISNDTGIMHVAGASSCPLISLFGPTNPKMWSPIGEKKYFIKNSNDINSIKVDDVLKLAEEILNETN